MNNFSKKILLASLALLCSFSLLAKDNYTIISNPEAAPHTIMSCNIRVALAEDSIKGFGWHTRKDVAATIMKRNNPDIICMQEVLKVQYEDLKEALPNYHTFGFVGPEMDAHPTGYHGIAKNVIFFSKDRYDLVSAGNYWLSETPEIGGSKSWETARARHLNWVRIIDKFTGVEFRVMDIHLDHLVQDAKEKQIQMALNEAAQYPTTFPQFLIGDYNSDITNEVIKMILKNGWKDTYTEDNGEGEAGFSIHEFEGHSKTSGRMGRIDFIFSKGPIQCLESHLVKDTIDGVYPSDHFFLLAKVVIK